MNKADALAVSFSAEDALPVMENSMIGPSEAQGVMASGGVLTSLELGRVWQFTVATGGKTIATMRLPL